MAIFSPNYRFKAFKTLFLFISGSVKSKRHKNDLLRPYINRGFHFKWMILNFRVFLKVESAKHKSGPKYNFSTQENKIVHTIFFPKKRTNKFI